jgi:pyrroline-5-carboxylate reductase
MLTATRIAFIGGGNMAESLLVGWLRNGLTSPERVIVSDPQLARRNMLAQRYGVAVSADNHKAATGAELLLLCVEPKVLDDVLVEVKSIVHGQPLVISVAAGYPLSRIQQYLPSATRVVRAMPNTPSSIGEGMTALSAVSGLPSDDQAMARTLFEAVGKVVFVEERLLDAVTGLSGGGPAFVFAMIEALADGGVLMGLPRSTSQLLAAQTMAGAARMVLEQGDHPGLLKDRVASPGGTTIAGLRCLEDGRLRGILMSAVEAATKRSQELSRAESSHH